MEFNSSKTYKVDFDFKLMVQISNLAQSTSE